MGRRDSTDKHRRQHQSLTRLPDLSTKTVAIDLFPMEYRDRLLQAWSFLDDERLDTIARCYWIAESTKTYIGGARKKKKLELLQTAHESAATLATTLGQLDFETRSTLRKLRYKRGKRVDSIHVEQLQELIQKLRYRLHEQRVLLTVNKIGRTKDLSFIFSFVLSAKWEEWTGKEPICYPTGSDGNIFKGEFFDFVCDVLPAFHLRVSGSTVRNAVRSFKDTIGG